MQWHKRHGSRTFKRPSHTRILRIEPLEERRLLAATTVTTLDDTVDFTDGVTSLREAIFAANTLDGADTIGFDPTLTAAGPATILLTQGELAITDSLTINGPGAGVLTIDASGNDLTPEENNGDGSRVFNISDGSTATSIDVTIEKLTITGGDVTGNGGGVLNNERSAFKDVIIRANAAASSGGMGGGIYASAGSSLQLMGSIVRDNSATSQGGGVYTDNSAGGVDLLLQDSMVLGNAAGGDGGGLSLGRGTYSLVNSTIARNYTAGSGGGIHAAITPTNNLLEIHQLTVSDNRANGSGGGIDVGGNLTVNQSTITDNQSDADGDGTGIGGGIVTGQLFLTHSIVANNLRGTAPNDLATGFTSGSYSLVETLDAGKMVVGTGNVVGQDPKLGPLSENGGPEYLDASRMLTHALLAGSPAIDAGDPAAVAGMGGVPEFDQRGEPFGRVVDGDEPDDIAIDIGAYERQFGETYELVVDTLADESDGDYSLGDFSLREAIELANANPGADSISFTGAHGGRAGDDPAHHG